MADSDSAFKMLLQLAPGDFVARFAPGAELLETITIELPREPMRADALLKIRFPPKADEVTGRIVILHIEVQSSADADMPLRLCQYAVLTYQREKIPVVSVVIYLEKCATPPIPWTMRGPDGDILTFHFQVVRLWEEPVEDWLQSGQVALMPFVPLLKGATLDVLESAINAMSTIEGPTTRGNAINYLLFFASRKFGEELLRQYLEDHRMLSEDYIVESPWYQYILRKGLQDGVQQGMQQGEEIGKHAGEMIALRDAISALAARRFPALEAEMRALLPNITDAAQLRELVLLVGTAPDEDAVRQGLPTP